jgi:hypothetical protein
MLSHILTCFVIAVSGCVPIKISVPVLNHSLFVSRVVSWTLLWRPLSSADDRHRDSFAALSRRYLAALPSISEIPFLD